MLLHLRRRASAAVLALVMALLAAAPVALSNAPAASADAVPTFGRATIASNDWQTCAVVNGGEVWCWGAGGFAELGNHTIRPSGTPVKAGTGQGNLLPGIRNAVGVAAGGGLISTSYQLLQGHSCALLTDGTVQCWGTNDKGQLGDGSTEQRKDPTTVKNVGQAVSITAGAMHTCVSMYYLTVDCWGGNDFGQLGNGSTTTAAVKDKVTVDIFGVVAVAAGDFHTCALLRNGTVQCWGRNNQGQLGDGTTTTRTKPVQVSGISNATQISAGAEHTCATLSGGQVKCWGDNSSGQLGDNTTTDRRTPVTVSGLTTAATVAAGGKTSCAVLVDGTTRCWGENGRGQVGNNSTTDRRTPVTVPGLTGVAAVAVGRDNTCAELTGGAFRCWGDNLFGQLGDGVVIDRLTPQTVSLGATASDISAGGANTASSTQFRGGHTCAVTGGQVRCWGYNASGQAGNGSTTTPAVPAAITGLAGVTKVSAGGDHSCALIGNPGTVKCWGENSVGQLGDGTYVNRSTPVDVVGVSNAVDISAGGRHSCAVLATGSVMCWGWDLSGQLGDGTPTAPGGPNPPTANTVLNVTGATAVSAGGYHTCAVVGGGAVKCWGLNDRGQLGNGTTNGFTGIATPVNVTGLTGATAISLGDFHSCAQVGTEARCWGYNVQGQVGNGANNGSVTTPATVQKYVGGVSSTLDNVASLDAGPFHNCVSRGDGSAYCWGDGPAGQLGNGNNYGSNRAVPVSGVSGITAVAAGEFHSCFLGATLKCAGTNIDGELNQNRVRSSLVPKAVVVLTKGTQPGVKELVPMLPQRIMDTRPGQITIDGIGAGIGKINAGQVYQLAVAGRGGVPTDAKAVVINTTVVNPEGEGWVTVFPCGIATPNASNLNYTPGKVIANLVTVKVGAGGKVCFYTSARTDLIADIGGFYPRTTSFVSTNPARLLDTRPGQSTVDGQAAGIGKRSGGSVYQLQVAGRPGVPSNAAAVVLNVTSVQSDGGGWVTAFPCGQAVPNASNLNFTANEVIPNLVTAKIGTSGRVCLFVSASTHLIADLAGYYPAGSTFVPTNPARLLETRPGQSTVDGQANGIGQRPSKSLTEVQVTGRASVPSTASWVVLNITAVNASGGGWVTVYPCGQFSNASNINYSRGQTIPNLVVAKVGASGRVCLYAETATDLIVDLAGYASA